LILRINLKLSVICSIHKFCFFDDSVKTIQNISLKQLLFILFKLTFSKSDSLN
jgi:hypothetical protein